MSIELPDSLVDAIATELTDRIIAQVLEQLDRRSPWLTTKQAAAYTKLGEGTITKLSASGEIPSHSPPDFGSKRKLFHVRELDRWLGYQEQAEVRELRQIA